MGDSVIELVLQVLRSGQFPPSLNHTFLALISKKNYAVKVSNYRPINLCNVIYKLISNVIANRLKLILPCIVSESQSVYVLEINF